MAINSKADKVTLEYDSRADVLHVTFGTGEPSFAEEIDDLLVMEYGIYSGAPTGFQLLHIRAVGLNKVEARVKRTLPKVATKRQKLMEQYSNRRTRLVREAMRALNRRAANLLAA